MNKKGAEMTIGTIVIIVLALIVLVVLVVGFTSGWSNLWGRISAFFGGSNVDAVVQACNVACATEARNDFCERDRIVTFENDAPGGSGVTTDGKKVTGTCEEFADAGSTYADLGFQKCDNLCA